MRSDAIFDNLYLGWCLGFGWYINVVLYLLLRDAFFLCLEGFSDGCRQLLHFMNDIWHCLVSPSTVYQLSYWGIFPFHLIKMSPYFELGHFHWSEISNGVCWDDISSSEALLSSLIVFMILGSICEVFLRCTSGLLLSWK